MLQFCWYCQILIIYNFNFWKITWMSKKLNLECLIIGSECFEITWFHIWFYGREVLPISKHIQTFTIFILSPAIIVFLRDYGMSYLNPTLVVRNFTSCHLDWCVSDIFFLNKKLIVCFFYYSIKNYSII